VENIPEELEISQSFTLHCSPAEKEVDGFDFDKELPATPPCDINPNEQDLLMNFSTSHFEVEDAVNDLKSKTPADEEEFVSESINNTELKADAVVESLIEESVPEEPEVSSSTEIVQAAPLAMPAVKEESVAEISLPPTSSESSKPEKISTIEPASLTEEPNKTRSVKSSKLIPVIGGRFDLSQLNSHVIELIYWRDSRKSGIVLGSVLAILLSLSIVSVVSVVSYASLSVLAITLSFRLYKNILQAVQKTTDGHPFKDYLEVDVTLPSEKVHEIADLSAARLNAALLELRRLFLVEDLVDSFKFGLALWALTYVGSWFNGITLVILAVVGVFSLPKVYETHQEKIDQNLELARVKVNEIVEKVQAVLPIGKKPKSQ